MAKIVEMSHFIDFDCQKTTSSFNNLVYIESYCLTHFVRHLQTKLLSYVSRFFFFSRSFKFSENTNILSPYMSSVFLMSPCDVLVESSQERVESSFDITNSIHTPVQGTSFRISWLTSQMKSIYTLKMLGIYSLLLSAIWISFVPLKLVGWSSS